MKSLIIITISLCLHSTLLHANDEDDQPWGSFGKQSVIGMSCGFIATGTTMTVVGLKKIYSGVYKPLNDADTLIESHASASGTQRTLKNNVFDGLSAIAFGTAITITGFVTIIRGLDAQIQSMKDK